MSAMCACGCGQATRISRQTDTRRGYVKGEPMRFLQGHGGHEKLRKALDDLYTVEDRSHGTPCWIWQGGQTSNGYGRTKVDGRMQPAHRVFFLRAGGVIPDGHQIDHLCRVRGCVNPEHLEAVTPIENVRRAARLTADQVRDIRQARVEALATDPVTDKGTPRKRVRGGRALRERLAAQFDIHPDYVKVIWRGDSWAA